MKSANSIKEFKLFFMQVMEDRKSQGLSCFNYDLALKYIERFANGREIPLKSIDHVWVQSFRTFLTGTSSFKNEKTLATSSARSYYAIVTSVIRHGINLLLIRPDALKDCKFSNNFIQTTEPLSVAELQRMAKADCDSLILKKAFLFSALSGLTWKEISSLTWKHIQRIDGQMSVLIDDQLRVVPLSEQAYQLLVEKENPKDRIFEIKWNSYLYIKLNKWAIRASILRNIKFETARVTFARVLLDQGVPIELISDLMGHKNIKSTLRLTQQMPSAIS